MFAPAGACHTLTHDLTPSVPGPQSSPAMTFLLHLAGSSKILQAILIILGTFVLEDGATVLSAMQVDTGQLAWWIALCSLYAGIILGDLGLYGLGRLASVVPWAKRFQPSERFRQSSEWLQPRLFRVVVISRFLPGMRLPTYTASGFLRANFGLFALAAILATLVWTSLLCGLSLKLGAVLKAYLGAWSWAGAVVLIVVMVLATRTLARQQRTSG